MFKTYLIFVCLCLVCHVAWGKRFVLHNQLGICWLGENDLLRADKIMCVEQCLKNTLCSYVYGFWLVWTHVVWTKMVVLLTHLEICWLGKLFLLVDKIMVVEQCWNHTLYQYVYGVWFVLAQTYIPSCTSKVTAQLQPWIICYIYVKSQHIYVTFCPSSRNHLLNLCKLVLLNKRKRDGPIRLP